MENSNKAIENSVNPNIVLDISIKIRKKASTAQ